MNKLEYDKIKNLKYREYCEYLKQKYGEATVNYFTKNWNKNPKVTRTKEGLVCHHICEDISIMLCNPEFAKMNPYEYQETQNLCYCDYLEHLLLHILICENPNNIEGLGVVGIGGVVNFIVPELNDLYSGWVSNQAWRRLCHEKVINDKDVYFELIKRFKTNCKNYPGYDESLLYRSFAVNFDSYDERDNYKIYKKLKKL